MVAYDEALEEQAARLLVLGVDSDVPDLGIRHTHDLARIGGIGENLLVARHSGVEDDLARTLRLGPERLASKHRSVCKNQLRHPLAHLSCPSSASYTRSPPT